MKNYSRIFAIVFVVMTVWLASVSLAGEAMIKPTQVPAYQPTHFPFDAGEKATYRASWNGIFAVATADIYTSSKMVDGKKVYHVRVEARSSKALDVFWKMRDTIQSTFDAKSLAPVQYTFNQRENSRVIDTVASYDRAAERWSVNRQQVGKKKKAYQFNSHNTLDPITAVYLARSSEFKVGDRLYFKVFGGRYQYLLELFVERKEPVALEKGNVVQAYRIVPRVQNITKRGYAQRFSEAAIWISADERRVPVKMSSKIIFGSVEMELIDDQRGTQAASAAGERPAS